MSEGRINKDLDRFRDTANALNRTVADMTVSMSEQVFVNKLLPILKEWVVDRKGDNVHLWAIAAGGTERPIIVNLPDGGFFMVPPPFNRLNTIDAKDDREIDKIHAINTLVNVKERDGETREAMRLGQEMTSLLNISDDTASYAIYTIQLAKIWQRYDLPMEQVLSDITLDLDRYDEFGYYIQTTAPTYNESEDYGEDELEF